VGVIDQPRLTRLLGGPEFGWLLERARRRLERGQSLDTTVTLAEPTAEQRAAVHRLLGRPPRPGTSLSVSLSAVDQVVRRSGACPDGLAAAVVALTGEVTDRAATAAALDQRWQEAFRSMELATSERGELRDWWLQAVRTGLVRRLAATPETAVPLLADLAKVVHHLPAGGEPVGRFAARVAGGAHALDDSRPLTTLVLGAARALSGIADGTGAEWRREVWASVGLLRDEVSTTVLTLGLPGDSTSTTGRALAAWQEAGQPVVLTLRQLVRDAPRLPAQTIFVCENPAVVSAAADELGSTCAPLVCTSGQPGAAVMHLLRGLAASGATLRYHGDFDWGGLRIGNVVFGRLPLHPWRFRTADYRAALRHGRELTGTPVASAQWDPQLASAMASERLAIEEEHVLDELLTDLAR
jgi:uncharacterized protein (TIGR02679 family)